MENNNNMNWILWSSVAFGIFLLFLILLPWNFKLKASYNALTNQGKIQLILFKLSIINFSFKIKCGFVELKKLKNGKTILVPIVLDSNASGYEDVDFFILLIKKIYFEQGTIYVNFGAKTDAFFTSMVVGFVKVLTSCLGAITKTKKQESRFKNKIYPSFSKDKLLICLKASIKISVFNVMLAFIQAKIKQIK